MPTEDPIKRRKGRPCKIQKEDLLDAGEELFSENGFEGTTIRQLAARCNCNIALISYYFGNKDGLYEAVLLRHFERASHHVVRDEKVLLAQWPEFRTPLERRIASLLFAISKNMVSHPRMQKILHREIMTGSRGMITAFAKSERSATKELRREIEERLTSGEFKNIDPAYAMLMLISPIVYSLIAVPIVQTVYGFKQIDEAFMRELCAQLARTTVKSWT